jgi:hypothetical protein
LSRRSVVKEVIPVPNRKQLPLPDYDQLPVGGLTHRIRSLTAGQVKQLLDYERGHADRAPVIQILTTRLAQLDAGQEPSSGGHDLRSERVTPPDAGSPVSPATAGPPIQPPESGELRQPSRGKGNRL